MKYYLYHIPGKKIGVTTDLEERVERQQGKIYIANKGTDATKYVDIYIAALCIGRLYAGDISCVSTVSYGHI